MPQAPQVLRPKPSSLGRHLYCRHGAASSVMNNHKKDRTMRNRIAKWTVWLGVLAMCWLPCHLLAAHHYSSGIRGQAVVSSDVGLDGSILDGSPVQTHVRVLTSRGRFVTSFFTAGDGSFEVGLSPGEYLLLPDSPPNPYWQPIQTAVRVHGGKFTTVTIGYYVAPL